MDPGPRRVPGGRRAGLRHRVARGPPAGHRRPARAPVPRGVDAARGAGRLDEPHPHRRPRDEQHVPPPVDPAQGGGDGGPREQWPADSRAGRGLARGRAPPLRPPAATAAGAGRPTRGGRGDRGPAPGGAAAHVPRPVLRPRGRGLRAAAGPAATDPVADRRSPAADAPPRRALGGPVGHVPGARGRGDGGRDLVGGGAAASVPGRRPRGRPRPGDSPHLHVGPPRDRRERGRLRGVRAAPPRGRVHGRVRRPGIGAGRAAAPDRRDRRPATSARSSHPADRERR